MGYDLHITRAHDWTGSEEQPITANEWLAIIDADPELSLAGYNGPYFALWKGASSYDEAWFDWEHGRIYTKNPDPPLIEKGIEIAEKLGARAVGDDGETYPGPEGDRYRQGSPPSSEARRRTERAGSTFWRRLFGK